MSLWSCDFMLYALSKLGAQFIICYDAICDDKISFQIINPVDRTLCLTKEDAAAPNKRLTEFVVPYAVNEGHDVSQGIILTPRIPEGRLHVVGCPAIEVGGPIGTLRCHATSSPKA